MTDPKTVPALSKLPLLAFAEHPARPGLIVMLRRGKRGYEPTQTSMSLHALNELSGASPAQIRAMLHGSIYGYDTPGADPDRYNERGEPVALS